HDLNVLPYPFCDEEFDEIYAFEVLEHVGRQGDYKFFFAQWEEFYRVIKPNGLFFGSCPLPQSPWAWGDPSHPPLISLESLCFLDKNTYANQVGKTALSDYRSIYKANWRLVWEQKSHDARQMFALKAVK